jgi:hypothetical protein
MLAHILIAVVIQAAVALKWRSWGAGAATATAWSVSREITQAEYRWIEQFGGHIRANMPGWGGLDPRVWQHVDPWLDWIVPALVTITIAVIASEMRGNMMSSSRG